MKQIIICLGFYVMVSFSNVQACGKSYKAADHLLEIFAGASTKAYKHKLIIINEHAFAAVYDSTHNWFVFYRPLNISELSAATLNKVSKAYKGYSIQRIVMFMNAEGTACYYSELVKNNRHIIISIDDSGSIATKQKPSLYKAG